MNRLAKRIFSRYETNTDGFGRLTTGLTDFTDMEDAVSRLKAFMDDEARSCSMDYGCITPLYVYRMWGGKVKLDKIEACLALIRAER